MIGKTAYSYQKAHEILWKHGHWRFLLAPIGLSVVLLFVLTGLCFLVSKWVSGWAQGLLEKMYDFPDWLESIWLILFFAIGLGTCYVAFRSLVMICYGPFLERLSVMAEKVVTGDSHEVPRSIAEAIQRPILMVFFSVLGSLLAVGAGFLLSLIPLIGVVLSGALLFPTQIFLATMPFIDPYLDRSGMNARDSIRLMREHFFSVFSLGLVGLGITLIPIVGWFLGPTYSAAAGIVFAILISQRDENRKKIISGSDQG